jgi:hypothetical protein
VTKVSGRSSSTRTSATMIVRAEQAEVAKTFPLEAAACRLYWNHLAEAACLAMAEIGERRIWCV